MCQINYLRFYRNVSKVEDAIDCYQRAANLFKMAKKWSQAGRAFCMSADLNSKSGRKHDAATNYVDSANCYKKTDPNGMYSNKRQRRKVFYFMYAVHLFV